MGLVGRRSMLLVICCQLNAADKLFCLIVMQVINLMQGPVFFPHIPLHVYMFILVWTMFKKRYRSYGLSYMYGSAVSLQFF